MSGRCDGCRWWSGPVGKGAVIDAAKTDYSGWGYCYMVGEASSLAVAADDAGVAGYSASLVTAPGFGCVQFHSSDKSRGQ